MSTIAPTYIQVCKLCKVFVNRSTNIFLKGKKRDAASLEFLCGASAGAAEAGNKDLADHLEKIAFFVAIRGFSEIERIAKDAP